MTLNHKYIDFLANFMIDINAISTEMLKENQKEHNISSEQSEVLWLLNQKGKLSLSDITIYQNVNKAAVSRRIKKLIELDFVRWTDVSTEEDQRLKFVSLTKKGHEYQSKVNKILYDKFEHIIDDINDDKINVAYDVLSTIHKRLTKNI